MHRWITNTASSVCNQIKLPYLSTNQSPTPVPHIVFSPVTMEGTFLIQSESNYNLCCLEPCPDAICSDPGDSAVGRHPVESHRVRHRSTEGCNSN